MRYATSCVGLSKCRSACLIKGRDGGLLFPFFSPTPYRDSQSPEEIIQTSLFLCLVYSKPSPVTELASLCSELCIFSAQNSSSSGFLKTGSLTTLKFVFSIIKEKTFLIKTATPLIKKWKKPMSLSFRHKANTYKGLSVWVRCGAELLKHIAFMCTISLKWKHNNTD